MSHLSQEVSALFSGSAAASGLVEVLDSILEAVREVGTVMRDGGYGHGHVGTTNDFGDAQLHADVATDEVFFRHFTESRHVHMGSSEERPVEVDCVCELPAEQGFSVAFDPLDGSSIVGANFAVGSIIGVWPGKGLLNRRGSEQVASMVAMYGPRVTVGIALAESASASGEKIAFEVTMHPRSWALTTPKFVVAEECKTFAPGNLRATADHPNYKALVNYWIDQKYTLRYSGGLVPDVYHILHKGGGVLSNASSKSAKAKLRLLYECAPIALLVEAAGGASTACPSEAGEACEPGSVLDVVISDLDKRIGVCFGSKREVARFIQYIFEGNVE